MRAHLTVRLGRDRGSVTLERRVRAHSEEFSYLSPGEMSRNLRNAWEQVPRVRLRPATRIILAADLGQARTLRDLPPVSTSQLEIMVATRCSEFFRMRGQQLVTRARWLERKRGSVSRAQAIAVDGAWLDAIDAALADTRLGDAPIRLEEYPMALEPPSRSRRRRDREGRVSRILITAGIAAWVLALGGAAFRLQRLDRALAIELAALEPASQSLRRVRQEFGAASAMVAELALLNLSRGEVARALAATVRALPDSSYLLSLSVSDSGRVDLSAGAPGASRFLAVLERRLAPASTRATTDPMPDPQARGWERFAVQIRLKP